MRKSSCVRAPGDGDFNLKLSHQAGKRGQSATPISGDSTMISVNAKKRVSRFLSSPSGSYLVFPVSSRNFAGNKLAVISATLISVIERLPPSQLAMGPRDPFLPFSATCGDVIPAETRGNECALCSLSLFLFSIFSCDYTRIFIYLACGAIYFNSLLAFPNNCIF